MKSVCAVRLDEECVLSALTKSVLSALTRVGYCTGWVPGWVYLPGVPLPPVLPGVHLTVHHPLSGTRSADEVRAAGENEA